MDTLDYIKNDFMFIDGKTKKETIIPLKAAEWIRWKHRDEVTITTKCHKAIRDAFFNGYWLEEQ